MLRKGKLVEIRAKCVCDAKATHAVEIVLRLAGKEVKVAIPVCKEHAQGEMGFETVEVLEIPTHEPIGIESVVSFPPRAAEIHVPSRSLGCPKCLALVSLDEKVFEISKDRVSPSFVCPQCGLHAWLHIVPTRAEKRDRARARRRK